jgi:hypothetical protein
MSAIGPPRAYQEIANPDEAGVMRECPKVKV